MLLLPCTPRSVTGLALTSSEWCTTTSCFPVLLLPSDEDLEVVLAGAELFVAHVNLVVVAPVHLVHPLLAEALTGGVNGQIPTRT